MAPVYHDPPSKNNHIPIKTIHPNRLLKTSEKSNKYKGVKEPKKMKKHSKNCLFTSKSPSKSSVSNCKLKQETPKTTLVCKSSSYFFNNEHVFKNSKASQEAKKLSNSASAVSMVGYDPVPPIPPRVPLKRSLSLTHHPKPPLFEAPSPNRSSRHIPISFPTHVPFIVDPLNPRRPATTLARSAPTLSTINTGNQLLLFSKKSRGNHKIITTFLSNQDRNSGNHSQIPQSHTGNISSAEYNDNHQNIISLARWPLAHQLRNNQHLTIDSLAGKVSVTLNEYIESPKMYNESNRSVNSKLTSNLTRNAVSNNNSFSSRSNSTTITNNTSSHVNNDTRLLTHLSNYHSSSCFVPVPTVCNQENKSNFFRKIKKLMSTHKKSSKLIGHKATRTYSFESSNDTNNSINWPLTHQTSSLPSSPSYPKQSFNDCKASIICRHCGKCRCKDCTRGGSGRKGCEVAVECLTCMCLVKPIFYHCLKDQDGEEDCSDEPCACCSQPHCFSRWSIMTLLLPCLPCLACYLPFKLLLCCPARHQTGCKCTLHSSNSSTFKILLESEVSSA